jgi:hypothetical protein
MFFSIPIPYKSVSREWYEWASQEKLMIRKLKDIENKIKKLAEVVYLRRKGKGEYLEQKQIEEIFFKRISYPLFLLLTGASVRVSDELEELIPQYEVETLRHLAIEDLKNVLKDLGHERPSKSDDALVEELINTIAGEDSKIVPPYPSPEFVLGFVSKTLSVELLEPYKEYSQFVHSYFTSWRIFPFSSVLEFKIFKHELSIFSTILMQLINSYLKKLFLC